MSKLIKTDNSYKEWITGLKHRIRGFPRADTWRFKLLRYIVK